jgi:hypothetical protein
MQVEIGTLVGGRSVPVLTYQYERREEDRLDRRFHRKDNERRVECRPSGDESEIQGNPGAVNREVKVDERHAAGERRNRAGKTLLPG